MVLMVGSEGGGEGGTPRAQAKGSYCLYGGVEVGGSRRDEGHHVPSQELTSIARKLLMNRSKGQELLLLLKTKIIFLISHA